MSEIEQKLENLRYIVHLGYTEDYMFTSGAEALKFAEMAKITRIDTYNKLNISIMTVEEVEKED